MNRRKFVQNSGLTALGALLGAEIVYGKYLPDGYTPLGLQPHGEWGSDKGYHRGDIGNFNADTNGNGNVSFSTDLWCLGCKNETKNILGKAIIVRQGEDDLVSQPSGAAGSRISCAGIIQ